MKCPKCGTQVVPVPRPASKSPEAIVARRLEILQKPGLRAVDLAEQLGCSVDTVHRVRREYVLK